MFTEVSSIELHKWQDKTSTNCHQRMEIQSIRSQSRSEKRFHIVWPTGAIAENYGSTHSENLVKAVLWNRSYFTNTRYGEKMCVADVIHVRQNKVEKILNRFSGAYIKRFSVGKKCLPYSIKKVIVSSIFIWTKFRVTKIVLRAECKRNNFQELISNGYNEIMAIPTCLLVLLLIF